MSTAFVCQSGVGPAVESAERPFACLTNHISGRGMTKALKERLPHIQILSLDYDPDTSFANIENRLQMLVLHARALEARNGRPDRETSSSGH